MSAAWRDEGRETRLQWLARMPLFPLAWLWAAGAALHRAAYRRAWLSQRQLACPVVSVGSLQVGGSGKTPAAAALARLLVDPGSAPAGRPTRPTSRVALASRGYGRRAAGGRSGAVVCVSNGREILADLRSAGDEALLLASEAPGVPVWVARDRGRAGEAAQAAGPLAALLLDDGFQHHRLARDLDLVCVDARAGLGRACLPRGSRREGLRALAQADAILLIDAPLAERDRARLERHAAAAPRFEAQRRVRALRPLSSRAERSRRLFARARSEPRFATPADLAGSEVGLLCGIARPDSFRQTVEALGARVVAERHFPDHHPYAAADFRGDWLGQAPVWLTTAKDAVKLREPWLRSAEVIVVDLEIVFARPRALRAWLETRLADLSRAANDPIAPASAVSTAPEVSAGGGASTGVAASAAPGANP